MIAFYGAFGATLQGKVLNLGPDRSLEATAGYWEGHYVRIRDKGFFYLENGNEIGIERSFSLVVRQDLVKSLSCYVGPMYNHFHYETIKPEQIYGVTRPAGPATVIWVPWAALTQSSLTT